MGAGGFAAGLRLPAAGGPGGGSSWAGGANSGSGGPPPPKVERSGNAFLGGKNLLMLALCEVVQVPTMRKNGAIWVAPDEDAVVTRFLFAFPNGVPNLQRLMSNATDFEEEVRACLRNLDKQMSEGGNGSSGGGGGAGAGAGAGAGGGAGGAAATARPPAQPDPREEPGASRVFATEDGGPTGQTGLRL
jgi:hypothetical protein